MNENIKLRLVKLCADYNQVRGFPFSYFYCPILFRDENVPLCRAHIINLAFPDSSRRWVVQRRDVDNFYGSIFESDFASIKYKGDQILSKAIIDKELSNKLEPKILLDDIPIGFYVTRGSIPNRFTRLEFDDNGKVGQLAIKMSPDKFIETLGRKWEISVERDIRISAVVSLIKSAHLTLFSLLGYTYALSTVGYFIGRQILGEFFQQNFDKTKSDVLDNAITFFGEYAPMVRPIQSSGVNLQGTISDNLILICKEKFGLPWALVVFVRTSKSLHAVLIPIFEHPDTITKFIEFLKDKNESLSVHYARFKGDHWNVNKESITLLWPKTGIQYP